MPCFRSLHRVSALVGVRIFCPYSLFVVVVEILAFSSLLSCFVGNFLSD